MAFPNETDYTYAERYGRTGQKYATPIDDSVTAGVVSALGDSLELDEGLTGAIADNILADLITDAGGDPETDAYVDSLIAALVADATYPAALGDAFEADTDLMAAIATAVSEELVSTFDTAVIGEIAHTGPADAVTVTVSDTGLDNVGDNGIVPGSVTFTITANDDSETLAVTDSDNGDGTGNLSGTGAGISVADDGVSTITYATGAWTITASEALKENEDILVDYSYSRDALVGDVGLTDAALDAIGDNLEADGDFLSAVNTAVNSGVVTALVSDPLFAAFINEKANPIAGFDITVAAETEGDLILADIQIVNGEGVASAVEVMFELRVITGVDPFGEPSALPADWALTLGASGAIVKYLTLPEDVRWLVRTDATGLLQIGIQDNGLEQEESFILMVTLPNGVTALSDPLTFSALI